MTPSGDSGNTGRVPVDENANQQSLDSLNALKVRLFAIPDAEIEAMSQADQQGHADSLHHVDRAIVKLETAQLQQVNNAFKAREQELATAAQGLQQTAAQQAEAVKVVQVVSQGLGVIVDIIRLLG